MEFNVGDVIVLRKTWGYGGEVGREQVVESIDAEGYNTKFLDNGGYNSFGYECEYSINCYLVRRINYQYENGVPVVWEGEL